MINDLTPAQIARFPEFVERWTKIGLCTEKVDRTKAEEAIRDVYRCAGLEPPRLIVWSGSPMSQAILYSIIRSKSASSTISKNVLDRVGSSVRDSVLDGILASVEASVRASIDASVRESVRE
ncbi:MAG: hypothetical protein ABFE01_08225, partial [Phycisphaerales bacterium]